MAKENSQNALYTSLNNPLLCGSKRTEESKMKTFNRNQATHGIMTFSKSLMAAAVFAGITQFSVKADVLLVDDFTSPTLDPAWVSGGPGATGWDVNTSVNAVVSLDTSGGDSNFTTLTRDFSSTTTDWIVELNYGWVFGNGSNAARDGFRVLDGSGNGYGVYIEQGSRSFSIGIERYAGGSYAGGSYATKPFDDNGFESGGALTPIRLEWNPASGLDLYLGAPGGAPGTASTLIVAWADTTYSSTEFSELQLNNINAGGFQSAFGAIEVTNAVPEPGVVTLFAAAAGVMGFSIRRRLRFEEV